MAVAFHHAGILAGLALALSLSSCARQAPQITLRVGVDTSPPFYNILPDGRLEGLAVDILNEAARRRNIKLIWTPVKDTSLDTALAQGRVDLWPLVAATPERRAKFFLSDPWMEGDYVLLSLQSHAVHSTALANGLTIAHARLNGAANLAHRRFPNSTFLVRKTRAEAVQSVCGGEAAAVIIESRVLDSILLNRPAGCENRTLAIANIENSSSALSIVALWSVQKAAAALRAEISVLADEGFVSRKLDQWTPISAEGNRHFWKARAAERQSRMYRLSFLCVVCLVIALASLTAHVLRLKKKAECAEASLREVERRFTAFMDNSPAVSFMKDRAGRLLYVNASFLKILGGKREDWYGKTDFEVWPPEIAAKLRADEVALAEANQCRQFIDIAPDATGSMRHWLTVKFPVATEAGGILVGGTAIDITESEHARRAMAESEERYRELALGQQETLAQLEASEQRWQLALQGAGDALWDWDLVSGKVFRSSSWKAMLGYEDAEIGDSPKDWEAILHPDDHARVTEAVAAHLRHETPSFSAEYRLRHKNGSWVWVLNRAQAVWDAQGQPTRMAGAHTNITERKSAEHSLALQAATDPLTGLCNRREFDRVYPLLLENARRQQETLTVCVCDMDRFKSINDSHGHAMGDRALAAFGKLLRKTLRETDLIARLGGDEFAVVMPKTSKYQARLLADRVATELGHVPFEAASGRIFHLTCSFGLAQLEPQHSGPAALLEAADRSLYQAKDLGRNCSSVA